MLTSRASELLVPHEVSLATRHVMQANRSKNTKPELLVRRKLREAGLPGYRLHWKKAPGRPDVCYPGRKVAVLVNGCYWHRCPYCALPMPKSNIEFWQEKFARNRARDERNQQLLAQQGWKVLVIWEGGPPRANDARAGGRGRGGFRACGRLHSRCGRHGSVEAGGAPQGDALPCQAPLVPSQRCAWMR